MWWESLNGRSEVSVGCGGSSTLTARVISLSTPPQATSSSRETGREVAGKPADSVARLFSEEGSFLGLHPFSPIADLSLGLGGAGLVCYCCGCVVAEEAGLEGPA